MDILTLSKLLLSAPWLVCLCLSDLRRRQLPNALTLGGAAVAIAVSLGVGTQYCIGSLMTGFLSALFLLLPFFLRAAGAGDVKMLFAAGIVAGPSNTLNLILLVSLAGLVSACVMLVLKKVNTARLKHYAKCLFDVKYDRAEGRKNLPPADSEDCKVPFGIAIACGLYLNLILQFLLALDIQ